MSSFILRRLLQSLVVLVIVLSTVFALTRLSGDPVILMLPPGASKADEDILRAALGLDKPIHVQYLHFLRRAARGDFGKSIRYDVSNMSLILNRLPATIQLTLTALGIALAIGMPIGILSAVDRNGPIDFIGRLLALSGQAIPFFWLALMLILLFSLRLDLLPTSGYGTIAHVILPSITLAMMPLARITRLLRASMLEVLGEDYVRTARAKGLREVRVITKHALQNASLPVVTALALQMGSLLSGAAITESIFAWPGMGRLAIDAVLNRDYSLVIAVVFASAVGFLILNLLADAAYAILDPRIRYG
jgi:peptide/nickel transport system permease protein